MTIVSSSLYDDDDTFRSIMMYDGLSQVARIVNRDIR